MAAAITASVTAAMAAAITASVTAAVTTAVTTTMTLTAALALTITMALAAALALAITVAIAAATAQADAITIATAAALVAAMGNAVSNSQACFSITSSGFCQFTFSRNTFVVTKCQSLRLPLSATKSKNRRMESQFMADFPQAHTLGSHACNSLGSNTPIKGC
jgi:hypothetical protein